MTRYQNQAANNVVYRFSPHSHMLQDESGIYVLYAAYEALLEQHRQLRQAVGEMHSRLLAAGVSWEDDSPSSVLPTTLIKEAVDPVIVDVVRGLLD